MVILWNLSSIMLIQKVKEHGDCVIRAICTALNEPWEDTYKGLLEVALDTGYAISCTENYEVYLKRRGYEKQRMPKKSDGKKYTVEEFAEKLAKPKVAYVINIARHTTVIKNKNLYDLWNCGRKSVLNYWIIK